MSERWSDLGRRYAVAKGVREDAGDLAPTNEAVLQRLWFEQVYANPLMTDTGEKIVVKQPGWWNKKAGPDFLRASLVNERGDVETGDVEVHLTPKEWRDHSHDEDPAYERVILHVVWQSGPKAFFPKTRARKSVRQVELRGQIKAPLNRLGPLFETTPVERRVGARLGRCQRLMGELSEKDAVDFLREAGWYRFKRKAALWRSRILVHGESQCLWLGLADALGYSENREAFGALARKLPIKELQQISSRKAREALLYGVAGFLPKKRLSIGERESALWLREVWDEWWKMRADWEEQAIEGRRWVLRGLRPSNRPERRLAVLALLSERAVWRRFEKWAKEGDPKKVALFFRELEHPYWSRHYTLKSKPARRSLALVGESRIQALLYNVIWPVGYKTNGRMVEERLNGAVSSLTNHPARVAAVRLLGGREEKMRGVKRSLLAQEGLLQVYRDFCLNDVDQCEGCAFPETVADWKEAVIH